MNRATPGLPPLDILRSLDWRPVLLDDLGEDYLVDEDHHIILIDTNLTIRQLAVIAARFLSEAAAQIERLLAP